MRGKITKRKVDELQPGGRDVFLWDTELPGFGCKVTPKGGRIYVLQYGQAGRDRRITIGRHGIDLTAEQARVEALRLRGLIATGETPTGKVTQRTEVITVAELGQRYLDEYAIRHKKPSGIAQDRRNLQNHVVPLMGKLRISAVERADVARVMREVAAGKTAKDEKTKHQGRRIVRGGEIVANRVQALLSKMFALAEDWKLRPEGSNPCRGVKRYAEHKVERFLSAEELARLGAALASEAARAVPMPPSEGRRGSRLPTGARAASIAALRLLLLTGCRVGEVLSLRWENVNLERRLLLLSDSKTGAKPVFLSTAAAELIGTLPRMAGTEYVFPGDRPGKPIVSLRKSWERVCRIAEIDALRLHDLRHTYASVGAADGLSLPVIGALLGHSQPATTARYAHLAASPLHEAADAIGARIMAAMDGKRRSDQVSVGE
ncbi:MAG: site-specific integrase [Rhodospirillales bacterium]|nr:site-specific integrase [Rhodospirillales bacterium]